MKGYVFSNSTQFVKTFSYRTLNVAYKLPDNILMFLLTIATNRAHQLSLLYRILYNCV